MTKGEHEQYGDVVSHYHKGRTCRSLVKELDISVHMSLPASEVLSFSRATLRSAPLQKFKPSPCTITQEPGHDERVSTQSLSSAIIFPLRAFLRSGLLRVRTAIGLFLLLPPEPFSSVFASGPSEKCFSSSKVTFPCPSGLRASRILSISCRSLLITV